MQYTKPGQTIKKAFSFSYSKLKNYATCPKRYYDIDIAKKYAEVESDDSALAEGNRVHKALELRVSKGTPLPPKYSCYEDAMQRVLRLPGTIMVEQQLAIREDLSPCDWFAKDAWYRAKGDVVAIHGPVAIALDYKTGKILEESEQLALLAECIFSHYPQVQACRTEFWWLKDDAATRENFFRSKRAQTWAPILPKVATLKQAHETMDFPPTPNGLCKKYCIVTGCPFHGVGSGSGGR